jgi:pyruvate,water dikinase
LYEVEQALNQVDQPLDEACRKVVEAIPPGWQYPDVCSAMLEIGDKRFECPGFRMTPWIQETDIVVQDERVGRICVVYLEERPKEDVGPFLKEEERLIRTIADRVGHSILYHQLHDMRREWEQASRTAGDDNHERWRGPIELLRRTDRTLYLRIARQDGEPPLLGWDRRCAGAAPGDLRRGAGVGNRRRLERTDPVASLQRLAAALG